MQSTSFFAFVNDGCWTDPGLDDEQREKMKDVAAKRRDCRQWCHRLRP